MPSAETPGCVVCVDVGSTFTKALLVDLDPAADVPLLATVDHPTTLGTDVMDGVDACLAALAATDPRAADAEVRGCSSAGGGLKIAVLGNEALVTGLAGERVALSSGGSVALVLSAADHPVDSSGEPTGALAEAIARFFASPPDVVLLVGGTDGGHRGSVEAAEALVAAGWRGPVVVAGNVEAQPAVAEVLTGAGVPFTRAANAVPRIGVLEPDDARAAIRAMFLRHVIGGKDLSRRPAFTDLVRGATPDVVLAGVEALADVAGDVVVVDVGGATTDVHSVVELDPEDAGLAREVVAPTRVTRTVEADLGMRWSAPAMLESAGLAGLFFELDRRAEDPGFLPAADEEHDVDETIARAAVHTALRRHAGRSRVVVSPEGRVVERTGTDLREVRLVVGSGGVLRHGRPGVADRVLGEVVAARHEGGWQLPERAGVVVDTDYVLVAAGLLAADHPGVVRRMLAPLRERAATPTVDP